MRASAALRTLAVVVCLTPIAASFPLHRSWEAVATYSARPSYDHAVMSSLGDPLPWGAWASALVALALAFTVPQYLSKRATHGPVPVGADHEWLEARRAQAYVVRFAWALAFTIPAVLIALTLIRPAMSLGLSGIWRCWQGPHEYAPILLGAALVLASCRPRSKTCELNLLSVRFPARTRRSP